MKITVYFLFPIPTNRGVFVDWQFYFSEIVGEFRPDPAKSGQAVLIVR